ncbi:hypothetical protein Q7P37_007542 [Cladosporium fusiforme]
MSSATSASSAANPSSTFRARPQGGILEGEDPSDYDPKNPIILFIIQASIIVIFCRLLHWPLSRIRQPRVIAEVIGGILLGPSVMGRIPGFSDAIFPPESIPNLNLVANLGLVLFLFLVGLEVDVRWLISNWRPAVSVGLAGMALPFGLGCALAWGLYNEFSDEPNIVPIEFGTFMLFVGVAMAITAFPVLCRILSELKLLTTTVGVIVLSAGVGNDVVGWILLALCVALVNAGSGLTALWVLLTCVARNGSLTDGPSQGMIVLTLMIALGSSFFTGVIGVHAIFGAFMAGLICPHEGGFAIKVTEKIEDLIGALFLPLYFALSGLNTDVGLLDNGITWGYTIAVIFVAFFAKFIGATLAARLTGLVWRESFTIGALMSCKGLVELIVLNIGLQARILSTRTFTIFVVMALVTTFATTPLTAALYPPWYQRKLEAWKRGEIDWDTGKPLDGSHGDTEVVRAKLQSDKVKNLLVYLRLDNMPTLLAFVSLLSGKPTVNAKRTHPSIGKSGAPVQSEAQEGASVPSLGDYPRKKPLHVHGIRLLELADRGSSVMKVSEVEEYSLFDPVINAFRVLGQIYNLAVSGEVSITPVGSFPDVLVNKAADESSDLLLLPWSETGGLTETQTMSSDNTQDKFTQDSYIQFVNNTLNTAICNAAVFINKGFSGTLRQHSSTLSRSASHVSLRKHRDFQTLPTGDRSHHVFLPFYGGADGRAALRLLLQLAENPEVTATIVHFTSTAPSSSSGGDGSSANNVESVAITNAGKEAAPWSGESDAAFFSTMRNSLPSELADRVIFESVSVSSLFDATLERAKKEVAQNPKNGGDIIVMGRGNTADSGSGTSCLGVTAQKILGASLRASLLIVLAKVQE